MGVTSFRVEEFKKFFTLNTPLKLYFSKGPPEGCRGSRGPKILKSFRLVPMSKCAKFEPNRKGSSSAICSSLDVEIFFSRFFHSNYSSCNAIFIAIENDEFVSSRVLSTVNCILLTNSKESTMPLKTTRNNVKKCVIAHNPTHK